MLPIDRRDQLLDPYIVAVEQGCDELRESVIGVDLQHAGEEILDIRLCTVSQQRYRCMMPYKRMSRIPAKRLTENDKGVFLPTHQIASLANLSAHFRPMSRRPS